jgi:hypothetical protein
MENTLLYFSRDDNERAVYPAKNFLGCDMSDADTMQVSFLKEDGSADAAIVSLTVDTTNASAKEAAKALAGALAGGKRGLTIIADTENSKFLFPFTAIEGIA